MDHCPYSYSRTCEPPACRQVIFGFLCIVFTIIATLSHVSAYADSRQTTCLEFEGSFRCTKPEVLYARQTETEDEVGYTYGYCDGRRVTSEARPATCLATLGTWDPISEDCIGSIDPVGEREQRAFAHAFETKRESGGVCAVSISKPVWQSNGYRIPDEQCNRLPVRSRWGYEIVGRATMTRVLSVRNSDLSCQSPTTDEVYMLRQRFLNRQCPVGTEFRQDNPDDFSTAYCVWNQSTDCSKTRHPIQTGNGCKMREERDYTGPEGIEFVRHYDSSGFFYTPVQYTRQTPVSYTATGMQPRAMGFYWRSNYDIRLHPLNPADGSADAIAAIHMPDGLVRYFDQQGNEKGSLGEIPGYLQVRRDARNQPALYFLHEPNGQILTFSREGLLRVVRGIEGRKTRLNYRSVAGASRLSNVTGPYGHKLVFGYDPEGNLSRITTPDNQVLRYRHEQGAVSAVVKPDGTRRYEYETGSRSHLLRNIRDENDRIYAHFEYDRDGRAVTSGLGFNGSTNTAENTEVKYLGDDSVEVFDALGTRRTLTFENANGVRNVVSERYDDGFGIERRYDDKNRLELETRSSADQDRTTHYEYNATNQKVATTTGFGSPNERTRYFEYLSPGIDVLTRMVEPSVYSDGQRITEWSFENKLVKGVSVSGFSPSGEPVTRASTFGRDELGRVTSIDGPRTDVDDFTRIAYHDCNTGGRCGQIARVVNALGHRTVYNSYDAAGRVTRMTDPNGRVTTYRYNWRGQVTLVSETDNGRTATRRTTQYFYDGAGLLKRVVYPDNATLRYDYNAAQLLIRVSDDLNNSVVYRYDSRGNRRLQRTLDPNGKVIAQVASAYDLRNRVRRINNAGLVVLQAHDAIGNLVEETDQLRNPSTTHGYDALSRLAETIDAIGGSTRYAYNVRDDLTAVTTPNGATTTYTYDDLGNRLSEVSPDRGLMTYSHDDAGNIVQQTDARGTTVRYTFDALNRKTKTDYLDDDVEDVTVSYDGCAGGKGRLCVVTDQTGRTARAYDAFGNVIRETRVQSGTPHVFRYVFDKRDRLIAMRYPTGHLVRYRRDALGRIKDVLLTESSGRVVPLVSGREYSADGLVVGQTRGRIYEEREYDQQRRLVWQIVDGQRWEYRYDANSNLLRRIVGDEYRGHRYDRLNRLTHDFGNLNQTVGNLRYDYDSNGNRIAMARAQGLTNFSYETSSNRLLDTFDNSSELYTAISTDRAGYVTQIRELDAEESPDRRIESFGWNHAGLLDWYESNQGGEPGEFVTTRYAYDYKRRRTQKNTQDSKIRFDYDLDGNILLETGATVFGFDRLYIWADGEAVGYVFARQTPTGQGDVTSVVVTDHLKTPRRVYDFAGRLRWSWEGDAFGDADPVSSYSERAAFPLRFPGQYYDVESGFHYNWNRYYSPRFGRYISSDPIGLRGGRNLFSYALNFPTRYSDRTGLSVDAPGKSTTDFLGVEALFGLPRIPLGVGGGVTAVFCDRGPCERRTMLFYKICGGASVGGRGLGANAVGGKVYNANSPTGDLSGTFCHQKYYSGWFVEIGAAWMGGALAVDIGIPYGTAEHGVGAGTMGASATACNYVYMGDAKMHPGGQVTVREQYGTQLD